MEPFTMKCSSELKPTRYCLYDLPRPRIGDVVLVVDVVTENDFKYYKLRGYPLLYDSRAFIELSAHEKAVRELATKLVKKNLLRSSKNPVP